MAFKCEKIDPTLREKFYKEEIGMRKTDPEKYSFLVTGIDKKDNWIRDYERNIISWFSPSMMAKRDGDYSERVWIKFLNLKGDNISFLWMESSNTVHSDDRVIYNWSKILDYRICNDMDFGSSVLILKDILICFGGGKWNNEHFPNFLVAFDF